MPEIIATAFLIAVLFASGCAPANRVVPEYDLVEAAPEDWTMLPDEAVLAATDYCEATSKLTLRVTSWNKSTSR